MQFSLRTLFFATTMVAIGIGIIVIVGLSWHVSVTNVPARQLALLARFGAWVGVGGFFGAAIGALLGNTRLGTGIGMFSSFLAALFFAIVMY